MMERRRRLVLWCMSACLVTVLFFQGRDQSPPRGSAAFLRATTAGIILRLKGDVPAPGIYHFPDTADLSTVINVTAPALAGKLTDRAILATRMKSGDTVEVVAKEGKHLEITLGRMKTREMMLLGIPLNPNEMDVADWECLPGIGPGLARNIVECRQKYGDYGSVESLQQVPGIGEKKLKDIARYF